jgi:predicted nucleic-acid-binding Zn-ribbon protein
LALICDKCKSTEYYKTQENVVSGMGWLIRGKQETVFKCKKCDVRMIAERKPKSAKADKVSRNFIVISVTTFFVIIVIIGSLS